MRAEDFAPGDTDLAWTRTTPWRSLLASSFDGLGMTPGSARIAAEQGNASAALLAGWVARRLGIETVVEDSAGPGITEVEIDLRESEDGGNTGEAHSIRLSRPDGRLATFSRTGQPERQLPLLRRDEVSAESLEQATGVKGLSSRSSRRTHVWRDPALRAAAAT